MVAEYGCSMADARRFYPVRGYQAAWWRYVLEAFEGGADFTPAGASGLTEGMLRELSRTTRGLRRGLPRFYLLAGARLAERRAA